MSLLCTNKPKSERRERVGGNSLHTHTHTLLCTHFFSEALPFLHLFFSLFHSCTMCNSRNWRVTYFRNSHKPECDAVLVLESRYGRGGGVTRKTSINRKSLCFLSCNLAEQKGEGSWWHWYRWWWSWSTCSLASPSHELHNLDSSTACAEMSLLSAV